MFAVHGRSNYPPLPIFDRKDIITTKYDTFDEKRGLELPNQLLFHYYYRPAPLEAFCAS